MLVRDCFAWEAGLTGKRACRGIDGELAGYENQGFRPHRLRIGAYGGGRFLGTDMHNILSF
jgi:hypothetical protein